MKPPVALVVERADDGRDVRLEEAVADHDQAQCDEHQGEVERRALGAGLKGVLGDGLRDLAVRADELDRPVGQSADRQLLAIRNDPLLGLFGIEHRAAALDLDLVALPVDRRVRLRLVAAEA